MRGFEGTSGVMGGRIIFEKFNNKVCCLLLFLEQEGLSMSHVMGLLPKAEFEVLNN